MATFVRNIAFVLAAAFAACGAAAQAFTIYPASPVEGQDYVVYLPQSCGSPPTVSNDASTITLAYPFVEACMPQAFVVAAKAPAAGTYQLQSTAPRRDGRLVTAALGSLVVRPKAAVQPPTASLTGLWWTPSQPGWALSITQGDSGQLFLVWYTYQVSSSPIAGATWYFVSGGQWVDTNKFSGLLASSAGSPLTRAYDPKALLVGTSALATISIASQDTLTFTVEPSFAAGVPNNLQLTRYKF